MCTILTHRNRYCVILCKCNTPYALVDIFNVLVLEICVPYDPISIDDKTEDTTIYLYCSVCKALFNFFFYVCFGGHGDDLKLIVVHVFYIRLDL